MNDWRRWRVPA